MKRFVLCIMVMSVFAFNAFASSLVVCFSGTGNTAALAKIVAEKTGSDLYIIEPEVPYTSADLNYNDRSSRSSIECNDPSSRPAIASPMIDIPQYDTFYIGFPIWWGDLPPIMNTFFDLYDFSGKVISPFSTSGGSGIATARRSIMSSETRATVTEGLGISRSRLSRSEQYVEDWLERLGAI